MNATGNSEVVGATPGVSAYDLPTRDKIPVLRRLLADHRHGLVLDIGVGTGFTTRQLFRGHRTVGLDVYAPNLALYRDQLAALGEGADAWCVCAVAAALPFRDGCFDTVLCSEVLEHLDDDGVAVGEIARVLSEQGRAIFTVPYSGFGWTSFLELLGVKTVHDYPGPEQHVRPGYSEESLEELLRRHGLRVERRAFYLRFFTRVVVDLVSLAHLAYQRFVHGRRSWTWADAAAAEGGVAFGLYRRVYPVLVAVSGLDRWISSTRGFGLIVVARHSRESDAQDR